MNHTEPTYPTCCAELHRKVDRILNLLDARRQPASHRPTGQRPVVPAPAPSPRLPEPKPIQMTKP
jgi:hypothetical protein